MRFITIILALSLFFGCYDDSGDYSETIACYHRTDLCGDGGYDTYSICCNDYDSCWWEVDGQEYYTVEYMFLKECGF